MSFAIGVNQTNITVGLEALERLKALNESLQEVKVCKNIFLTLFSFAQNFTLTEDVSIEYTIVVVALTARA